MDPADDDRSRCLLLPASLWIVATGSGVMVEICCSSFYYVVLSLRYQASSMNRSIALLVRCCCLMSLLELWYQVSSVKVACINQPTDRTVL